VAILWAYAFFPFAIAAFMALLKQGVEVILSKSYYSQLSWISPYRRILFTIFNIFHYFRREDIIERNSRA